MKKVVLISLLILSGCVRYNGSYDALSTKPITLYDLNQQNNLVAPKVEETLSRHVAVVIPFAKAPTLGRAIEIILDKYNGDYIRNAKVETKSFQIVWIYHYRAWKITGDVIKTNKPL
ncbi:MAG: hypothetical protein R3Y43_03300 [Alphaproteobacteria bacterium]